MALLLRAENLRVLFGPRTLFDIDTIEIFDGDRIGLIGGNGAGKSTLLSVLHGERPPDTGTVRAFAQSAIVRQFGLPEEAPQQADRAIQAQLRAKADMHPGISGGELERLRIARALSVRAPLLFADEPTTNLDFEGVAAASKALARHQGALVLVSHDRALLDTLCTAIWALSDGKLRVYPGNYSAYKAQKAQEDAHQRFLYDQYRTEQARLRAAISDMKSASDGVRKAPRRMGNSEARLHKRGGGATAKKRLDQAASALQSRLDGLEEKERPREAPAIRMALSGGDRVISATAVQGEHLTLSAGGKILLRDASFVIPTGKRTVLVGPNGSGKTTLLRAIRDQLPGIRHSPGVAIGWFGQETLDTLDPSRSLLDNVLRDSILPAHEARAIMARMGLSAGDMEKPAAILSGGERAKAALARLMVGSATLLLLDEPGNHLDLQALEALEDMLGAYAGTMLLVSHDRRMIDQVADRLLLLQNGAITAYEGNLSGYEAATKTRADADLLTEDILRMRMSALLGKMSALKKGEDKAALAAECDALQAQLRALRK